MSGAGTPSPACSLCGTGVMHATRRFTDDPYTGHEIRLASCGACGALALVPRPSDALLADQYREYFRRRTKSGDPVKVPYFTWLLRRLGLPLAGQRVIDLGAGEGHFLRAAHAVYPTAVLAGVEPLWTADRGRDLPAHVVAEALEPFLATYNGPAFHAVFLLDVLEHLVDPGSVLRAVSQRLLTPGGWVVATMPNAEAWSRTLLGPLWPQYKVEHLHYFSRRSLEQLTGGAGLSNIRLEPHVKRLPLGYLREVGQSFGPTALQQVWRLAGRALPRALAAWHVSVRWGEWLLVAQRPGDMLADHAPETHR